MKRILVAVAVLGLLAAACATEDSGTDATPTASGSGSCEKDQLNLLNPGELTIGTDDPAFQPWFAGKGSYDPWKAVPNQGTGNPASGDGFESATAYAIADQLGFSQDEVSWVPVNFNQSYKPGPKDFDFDINQISYSSERAQAVTFSDGYYDVNQALVVNKGTPIADASSIADLKGYKLAAQIGTTSYALITDVIQPSEQPAVFDNSTDVINALNNEQIDGYVVDAPTAYVNVLIGQAENGTVVGQFPNEGEYFGLVFAKDNPLVTCVNEAISALQSEGSLDSLQEEWLANLDYPVLE